MYLLPGPYTGQKAACELEMFHLLPISSPLFCHTRFHLGYSAKLRIWQVSACKMEPRSGIIIGQNLYVAAAPIYVAAAPTRPDHPTG